MLVSRDRIIEGRCECCEAFAFDVERNADGVRIEHLKNIVIHFSAPSKERVIDAARKLAQAAGMPECKVATINADSAQRYEWRDSREQVRQAYTLELQFTRADRNLELYLSLGADAI
jgi:hypothetical protein